MITVQASALLVAAAASNVYTYVGFILLFRGSSPTEKHRKGYKYKKEDGEGEGRGEREEIHKHTELVPPALSPGASSSWPSSAKSNSPYVLDWAIAILSASTTSIFALPTDPFAASRRDCPPHREGRHLANPEKQSRSATPLGRCCLELGNPVCRFFFFIIVSWSKKTDLPPFSCFP